MTGQDKGFREKVYDIILNSSLADEATDRIVSLCTAEVDAAVRAERERIAKLIEGPDYGYTELAASIRLSKLESEK